MRIINKTKNIVLANDVIIANTLFGRMKGLLWKKELKIGTAMILRPCNSIHTFFMRFPIDVIFMSKSNKVVNIIFSMKPNRISGINFSASCSVEFPAGSITPSVVSKGDLILPE